MEDILASIRRIIAEDPPGSRPELPPQASRAPAAAPAPADPVREPVQSDPVFSSRPSDLDFPRMSPTGKREVEAIPLAQASDSGSDSLDMQLADVLGTVRGAVAQLETRAPAGHEPNSSAAAVQAALDSLVPAKADAPALEAAPAAPASPRFTFTRDGFDPATDKAGAAAEPVADPFEFSLGPSPFARAPTNERAAPEKSDRPADPFGSLVPSRDVLQMPSAPIPAAGPAEPPLSSLRAPFAPAEPARSAFPEPVGPAPAAFVPAAPVPQDLGVPVARQENPYRSSQAPSLGEIATSQPEAPAFAAVETSFKEPPPADFGLSVPAPAAPAVQPDVPVAAPVATPPAAIVEPAPLPAAQAAAPAVAAEPAVAAHDPVAAILDQIAASPVPPAAATPETAAQSTPAVIQEPAPAIAAGTPEPAAPVQVEVPAPVAEETVDLQPSAEAAQPHTEAMEAVFEDAHVPEPEPVPAPQPIAHEPQPAFQQALVSAHPGAQTNSQEVAARSMEDTVAELLRPMLRNWLAENMPRIVERALRKELDESNRSEHKSAAE